MNTSGYIFFGCLGIMFLMILYFVVGYPLWRFFIEHIFNEYEKWRREKPTEEGVFRISAIQIDSDGSICIRLEKRNGYCVVHLQKTDDLQSFFKQLRKRLGEEYPENENIVVLVDTARILQVAPPN